jgi:curved DNA-binding protein CbpA
MTVDPDPYRTLGLSRGASLDQIKAAYRRLAKANHPDAAGEAALPRFLAIQAAYELIVLNGPKAAAARRPRPSSADPTRADATNRAYSARGSRPRSGPAAGGTAGGAGGAGRRPSGGATGTGTGSRGRGTGAAGPAGAAPGAGGATGAAGTRRRNKATLGSTSYDDADSTPFEPDWGGASWYGTTSGTYWTLNPKEYADPRKHGPEYQARARRATGRAMPPTGAGPAATNPDGAGPAAGQGIGAAGANGSTSHDGPTAPGGPAARPTHTTSSWWESTAGPAGPPPDPTAGPAHSPPGPPRPETRAYQPSHPTDPEPLDLGKTFNDLARALLDEGSGGIRGRAIRAVVGWLPLAFGIGWIAGEMTGCGRFAATCDGSADPFVIALQVGLLALLLAVPILASLTTMATITLLVVAAFVALVLSATGAAADGDSRRATLGAVLVLAWLAGLAIAGVRRARAMPARADPTRPVS